MGHVKPYCYKLKNKNGRESKDAANVAKSVKSSEDDYVLSVSNTEGVDFRIFDSRATSYISSKQDYFSSFKDCISSVLLSVTSFFFCFKI